ncbi:transmembrane emp24 domain-containing protein p24delta9-like isoform X2 [Syzygium oleosum]|uniref:transmembrane emp24 domain-containing protein p24delta9-like isoform X2 n=1 Tax=Syzygium oleosum TaxID=219896 RepID=UPI0024B8DBA6|nr:transmembrane emp24 domain-containing protein p24delta9-like isoform X2 [Syzygium oleosum]
MPRFNAASRVVMMLICMWKVGNCMRFDLESGRSKCITEDIKINAMTVGKYSLVNPNEGYPIPDDYKLTVKVNSPQGHNYHHSDHVDSDFDWRTGVAAKDWSSVAKKGNIEAMEVELKKLLDKIASIHEEMFYLREREEEMQKLNRSTNSKMGTFSFLSLLICLSVAGLQFWHLKSFFERKKLL